MPPFWWASTRLLRRIIFVACGSSSTRPARMPLCSLEKWKWMKLLWWPAKGLRGRGAAGKVPVFGLLKRGGKVYARMISDIKSSTLQAIMEEKIVPTRSSIPTPSPPTIFWIFRPSSTTGSTMRNCLPIARITSTVSRISGTRPSAICVVLMAFPDSTFLCFSRNANGDSITQTPKFNYYS